MKKVIIFSHESDIDGMGSIILGKLAFHDIDYVLAANIFDLEIKFRKTIESGKLDIYDHIYITDLALHNPSLDMVNNSDLAKKVLVFDHHKTSIDEGLNNYNFTIIKDKYDDGRKTCATGLFYEYLVSSGFIARTKAIEEFVELTRLEDTWELRKTPAGIKAHDVAILFNVLGIQKYIQRICETLLNSSDKFDLSEEDTKLVETKKQEYLAILQGIWSGVEFFVDAFGNDYAALFADYGYRNELIEYVRNLGIEGLKYLIIVALERGQKSYRNVDPSFSVDEIAMAHGGGGHPAAASVQITDSQKKRALILKEKSNRESLEYLVNCNYKKKDE